MGFEPFFRKELSDWWHSRRAGVIAIVTSLLVISVAIVPWLQVTFPPTGGTPPDVSLDPTINVLSANWVTWLTIITISAAMSLLVGERDKGTLAWSLSNPLSRQALLVAKWSAGTLMYALFGVLLPVRLSPRWSRSPTGASRISGLSRPWPWRSWRCPRSSSHSA